MQNSECPNCGSVFQQPIAYVGGVITDTSESKAAWRALPPKIAELWSAFIRKAFDEIIAEAGANSLEANQFLRLTEDMTIELSKFSDIAAASTKQLQLFIKKARSQARVYVDKHDKRVKP